LTREQINKRLQTGISINVVQKHAITVMNCTRLVFRNGNIHMT